MANPIAQDAKGNQWMLVGKQWLPVAPGGVAPSGGGGRVASEDEKRMIEVQHQAQAAQEVAKLYQRARPALDRLHTGQLRGNLLEMGITEPGGGFLDKAGAALIGGPLSLLGYITPQDKADYQTVRAIQAEAGLQRNTGEKGTQTEGDAARNKLLTIDVTNEPSANAERMDAGQAKLRRGILRPSFYSQWIKKYGSLSAPNEQGKGVEQVFQEQPEPGGELHYNPRTGKLERH